MLNYKITCFKQFFFFLIKTSSRWKLCLCRKRNVQRVLLHTWTLVLIYAMTLASCPSMQRMIDPFELKWSLTWSIDRLNSQYQVPLYIWIIITMKDKNLSLYHALSLDPKLVLTIPLHAFVNHGWWLQDDENTTEQENERKRKELETEKVHSQLIALD